MCLAQEHNAVTPVKHKPADPWSRVKHSSTEPLHSIMTNGSFMKVKSADDARLGSFCNILALY